MANLELAVFFVLLVSLQSATVPVDASATTTTTPPLLSIPITASQLSALRNKELAKHTLYRKQHGLPAHKVNKTLQTIAQAYALELANTHTFQHSPGAGNLTTPGKYGENLYKFWGSPTVNIVGGEASDNWYGENKNYNYQTGTAITDGSVYGHFTAMIWKNTATVGFGFAKVTENLTIEGKPYPGEAIYVVANYYAVPNVGGQFIANVPPPK